MWGPLRLKVNGSEQGSGEEGLAPILCKKPQLMAHKGCLRVHSRWEPPNSVILSQNACHVVYTGVCSTAGLCVSWGSVWINPPPHTHSRDPQPKFREKLLPCAQHFKVRRTAGDPTRFRDRFSTWEGGGTTSCMCKTLICAHHQVAKKGFFLKQFMLKKHQAGFYKDPSPS